MVVRLKMVEWPDGDKLVTFELNGSTMLAYYAKLWFSD